MENKDIIKMYNHNLHKERLSVGRIAAITSFTFGPIFYLKDVNMTKYVHSTFIWRLIPMIFALLFMIISFTKYRNNQKLIKIAYLSMIFSTLVMMFCVFYQNYGTEDNRFNSFLIAGMVTTLLIIQIFSAPIRKYIIFFHFQ